MDISESAHTDSTPRHTAGFSFCGHPVFTRVLLPAEPFSFFLGEYRARKSQSITGSGVFYAGPVH